MGCAATSGETIVRRRRFVRHCAQRRAVTAASASAAAAAVAAAAGTNTAAAAALTLTPSPLYTLSSPCSSLEWSAATTPSSTRYSPS